MGGSRERSNGNRRRVSLTRVRLRRINATRLYGRSKRNLFIYHVRRRYKSRMIIPTKRGKRSNLRHRDKLRGKGRSVIRNMRLPYTVGTNNFRSLRKRTNVRVLLRGRRRHQNHGTKSSRKGRTILRTRLHSRLRRARHQSLNQRNRGRRSSNGHHLFRPRIVNMSTMNYRNQGVSTRNDQTTKRSRTIPRANRRQSINVQRRIFRINRRKSTQRGKGTLLSLGVNTNKVSSRRVRRRRTWGTRRRRHHVTRHTTNHGNHFFKSYLSYI